MAHSVPDTTPRPTPPGATPPGATSLGAASLGATPPGAGFSRRAYLEFLAEARRDPRATGAFAPSGRRLAAALAEPLRERAGLHGRPLRVLEVGAGTGSVTRALLPLLGPGDRLDVVEANPRFAAGLSRALREGAAERRAAVQVYAARVERVPLPDRYDVVVSGLPFTNFAPADVDAIMARYLRLLRPGGSLTYFAYLATAPARALVASAGEAARHRAVERVLAGYRGRLPSACRTVWGNPPPARVWRLWATGAADLPGEPGAPGDGRPPAGLGERGAEGPPGSGG